MRRCLLTETGKEDCQDLHGQARPAVYSKAGKANLGRRFSKYLYLGTLFLFLVHFGPLQHSDLANRPGRTLNGNTCQSVRSTTCYRWHRPRPPPTLRHPQAPPQAALAVRGNRSGATLAASPFAGSSKPNPSSVWKLLVEVKCRAGQGRAGQGRAGQGRAGQGRAGQGRAGQGRAAQGSAAQRSAGQIGAPMVYCSGTNLRQQAVLQGYSQRCSPAVL